MSDNNDAATFSWGSNTDANGSTIGANSTEVYLPPSATDADIALVVQRCKQLQQLHLNGCDQVVRNSLQDVRHSRRTGLNSSLCLAATGRHDAGWCSIFQQPNAVPSKTMQSSAATNMIMFNGSNTSNSGSGIPAVNVGVKGTPAAAATADAVGKQQPKKQPTGLAALFSCFADSSSKE
jgi:hypothetical protein